jgi:hypothetical protein
MDERDYKAMNEELTRKMTPKEKAKELYNKYEFVYIQNYTSKHEVKQCVIILIDELLNMWYNICHSLSVDFSSTANTIYWESVKEEINKI